MGKRSEYDRKRLDFYPTPYKATKPLLQFLPQGIKYCEPCAGSGDLIEHLQTRAECVASYDVDPQAAWIERHDATFLTKEDLRGAAMIITNPPWERTVLHQIIERCAGLAPTWLLFDADWAHTRQAAPYLGVCHDIVSVGRVKWIEDSDGAGKDNCCWYHFDSHLKYEGTHFWNTRNDQA